jgi:serine-type D-Ala-D-Ala carboxypeptidase/endopeptidase
MVAATAAALAACAIAGCSPGREAQSAHGAPSRAHRATAPAPPEAASITRVFDTIHKRYAGALVGICMGAIDGSARAVKCYGTVSRESNERPTPSTLFQIASISKTFTTTLLALRVSQGKVRLEDPLRNYIPLNAGSSGIPGSMTLLDLANHYSGLPRSTPVGDPLAVASSDEYFRAAASCESRPGCAAGPPGGQYEYSNFAYGVLGEALARNDGHRDGPYSAWEKDNEAAITKPLGLPDTHSWLAWRAIAPNRFDARRARALNSETLQEAEPPMFPPAPWGDAAGGLYSSSNDMLKWLSYSMGLSGTPALAKARPYLYDTPSLIRSREDPPDLHRAIGLAWRVDLRTNGEFKTTCISKDGLSRGFSSHMVFVKHRRVGAFVLLNNAPENPSPGMIARDLINSLPSAEGSGNRATCGPVEGY